MPLPLPNDSVEAICQQVLLLAQEHMLPEKQQQQMLQHVTTTWQLGSWQGALVRRWQNGQIHLLTIRHRERDESWELRVYPLHTQDRTTLGALTVVETRPNSLIAKIHISFRAVVRNQGLGSWVLSTFFAYCHSCFESVIGEIARVDFDDVAMLNHFYTKHGFTVTLDYDLKQGEITRPFRT
jgi:GNAT superfamily N-acetyltransferase